MNKKVARDASSKLMRQTNERFMDWIRPIALLWAGIVLGCSFVATPAKFRAPSLSMSVALEVGRVTFRSLAAVEIFLILACVVLLIAQRRWKSPLWLAMLIFAIQWLAIMPLLNAQTDAVIQGRPVDGPPWHIAYILLEGMKALILIIAAVRVREAVGNPDQANL